MNERPRLRAPGGEGEVLAVPPFVEATEMVARNQTRVTGPLASIRDLARRELLALAGRSHDDTTDHRDDTLLPDVSRPDGLGPLLLAGHQPELFHPGVWAKNFALAGLARRLGGTAINLIIDSDTLKSTSIRVPHAADPPSVRPIAFDVERGESPWEERFVLDRDTFSRFGDVVAACLRPWGYEPIIGALWPAVLTHLDEPIGQAFSAARRSLERRWGCDNAEVPMSALCQGEGFAHFAALLLGDLENFHRIYNDTVRAHRARHRIRSRNHPVPDLAARGGWLELPLWGWRAGERRGRLLARREDESLRLSTGQAPWPTLPPPDRDDFLASWRDLERVGYKVRPRALATTLFARLFLADLFVHGIGGAVYDELTDEIVREFFHLDAPEFMVVSATVRLPLPTAPVALADQRRLIRAIRDLDFNPQRHLDSEQAERFAPLLLERRHWVARLPETRAERRERFRHLRWINEQLHPPLADRREALRRESIAVGRQLRLNAELMKRDYSFCLYPEGELRALAERLLGSADRGPRDG